LQSPTLPIQRLAFDEKEPRAHILRVVQGGHPSEGRVDDLLMERSLETPPGRFFRGLARYVLTTGKCPSTSY
jgi:hypothetical protein